MGNEDHREKPPAGGATVLPASGRGDFSRRGLFSSLPSELVASQSLLLDQGTVRDASGGDAAGGCSTHSDGGFHRRGVEQQPVPQRLAASCRVVGQARLGPALGGSDWGRCERRARRL